jgi:fumarylacetoacetate (FAA) hydrolase
MKLATYRSEHRDGQLVVVSRDRRLAVSAAHIAPTLLAAVEHWDAVESDLRALQAALEQGRAPGAIAFDPAYCMAPLPRTFQWCDGSAFLNHARLMERAFNTPPIPDLDSVPLMYQGAGDDFLGAQDDVPMASEEFGIDFEGEFGVITGNVPMGTPAERALDTVRLLVQINDWSLRALGPREMRSGFGFLQAKPSSSFAPLAITPDELGAYWRDGRVHLDLDVHWNGKPFGSPNGREMNFGFGELIAHAARTRRLGAGTIVGSGTVSNEALSAGSACIAERRVLEILAGGRPRTGFMRFGDCVTMAARLPDGDEPFGRIDQHVVEGRRRFSAGAEAPAA